jgi:hypothetical protein
LLTGDLECIRLANGGTVVESASDGPDTNAVKARTTFFEVYGKVSSIGWRLERTFGDASEEPERNGMLCSIIPVGTAPETFRQAPRGRTIHDQSILAAYFTGRSVSNSRRTGQVGPICKQPSFAAARQIGAQAEQRSQIWCPLETQGNF